MSKRIILLSGPVSSGKSELAKRLIKNFGGRIIKTRDVISKISGVDEKSRLLLQKEGDKLDKTTKGKWVLSALHEHIRKYDNESIFVVDSVRIEKQIDEIRKAYHLTPITHLHLNAPIQELKKRYSLRYKKRHSIPTYEKIRQNQTEKNIDSLKKIADVVIDTQRCIEQDVLVRAASSMSLYCSNDTGYVDVIIGGNYGSEGKGNIAAHISKEYDLLIRVGGPNAGHKVFEEPEPYTHFQLPSGTRKSNAELLLGPGMVINPTKLLKEIADCKVSSERLSIDPQAMIIEECDIDAEKSLEALIGSTAQGVGHATARKILHRGKSIIRLAKDIPDLRPFIKPAIEVMEKAFSENKRILLEGTQRTGLSLHHGTYPYVTSRDTTVSGCIADAGIPPSRVRRVIMVCRTYPIRVGSPKKDTSGPMITEMNLEDIHERSKISLKELQNTEIGSTTGRDRRIAEFDWDLIKKSAFLNGPTDIALTFADYIHIDNRKAMRFEQLTKDTINLIEEIEHVTRARVSLISTDFDFRGVIDRRDW